MRHKAAPSPLSPPTSQGANQVNGMAPWSVLEELHRITTQRLTEALQPGTKPSAVVFHQARQLLEQSEVTARPLLPSERADMELLRAIYIKALLKAMESDSPSASILLEARCLWESMRNQGHVKVLEGEEMPFKAA